MERDRHPRAADRPALGFELANAAGEQGRLIPPDPDIENTMLVPSLRAPDQPEEEDDEHRPARRRARELPPYERAQRTAQTKREELIRAIHAAYEADHSYGRIAREIGLSHEAVRKMAQRSP